MKHPSIRLRLMLGTGLIVTLILILANIAIYGAFERTLRREVDRRSYFKALHSSASPPSWKPRASITNGRKP